MAIKPKEVSEFSDEDLELLKKYENRIDKEVPKRIKRGYFDHKFNFKDFPQITHRYCAALEMKYIQSEWKDVSIEITLDNLHVKMRE